MQKLEAYRRNRGLSYSELAAELKLSKTTTYRLCQGSGNISVAAAYAIVRSHKGIDYADLVPAQAEATV